MVYNPDAAGVNKERLTAFVTTDLTSDQLDAVQEAFGRGACSQSPVPTIELFIEDRAEYHGLTHADIRRAVTGEEPFLVIDEQTPEDGGIWYIEGFASEDEVEDGEAENTNVVWKIRLKIEDVPIMYAVIPHFPSFDEIPKQSWALPLTEMRLYFSCKLTFSKACELLNRQCEHPRRPRQR